MIHIGSAAFYQDVRHRMDRCDVVLFEGVRSVAVRILTAAYTLAARSKRLGLVTQADALRVAGMKQPLIHADSPPSGTAPWGTARVTVQGVLGPKGSHGNLGACSRVRTVEKIWTTSEE